MNRHIQLLVKILEYARMHADGESPCFPEVPCYSLKQINYHIYLCVDAGFLEAEKTGNLLRGTNETAYSIYRLTWLGHEVLDGKYPLELTAK